MDLSGLGIFAVFVDSLDIDSAPVLSGWVAVVSPRSVIVSVLPRDVHICDLCGFFDAFLLLFDE